MPAQGYAFFLLNKQKAERPEEFQKNAELMQTIYSALPGKMDALEAQVWFQDMIVFMHEGNTLVIFLEHIVQYQNVLSRFIQPLYEAAKSVIDGDIDLYIMNT